MSKLGSVIDRENLYAFPSKLRLTLYLMLSGGVTLLSLVGIGYALRIDMDLGPRVFLAIMCANPAFFLGRLSLGYGRRLLQNGPDIAIDEAGLLIRAHAEKPISWDNILRIQLRPLAYGQSIFNVWLLDETLDPPRKSVGWLTRYSRRKQKMGDVIFATEGTNVSIAEVQQAISSHLNWMAPCG